MLRLVPAGQLNSPLHSRVVSSSIVPGGHSAASKQSPVAASLVEPAAHVASPTQRRKRSSPSSTGLTIRKQALLIYEDGFVRGQDLRGWKVGCAYASCCRTICGSSGGVGVGRADLRTTHSTAPASAVARHSRTEKHQQGEVAKGWIGSEQHKIPPARQIRSGLSFIGILGCRLRKNSNFFVNSLLWRLLSREAFAPEAQEGTLCIII